MRISNIEKRDRFPRSSAVINGSRLAWFTVHDAEIPYYLRAICLLAGEIIFAKICCAPGGADGTVLAEDAICAAT